MAVVVIDDAALAALLNSPTGPIANEVARVANTTVLAIAQATISRPWAGSYGPTNPPPGPPLLRTGDLRNSLTAISVPGGSGIGAEVDIVPLAIHRGKNYGQILLARGYRFLPDAFYV